MTTENVRVGMVDDDAKLVGLVKRYLESHGITGVLPLTPQELLGDSPPSIDLLILDVMMPGMDGFEVLRRLRGKTAVPVIFLSAKSEVFDRIVGLELGADDYLTKPFEPRELLARIEAVLRRHRPDPASGDGERGSRPASPGPRENSPQRQGCLEFRELTLDLDRQLVLVSGREASLTSHEFQMLRLFCQNPNIILTRQQIMDWLAGNDFGSFDRSIDVGISRLRKKIETDPGRPELLKTAWGRGYQLVVTRKDR